MDRGLDFRVGVEPLMSDFTSRNGRVLATDLPGGGRYDRRCNGSSRSLGSPDQAKGDTDLVSSSLSSSVTSCDPRR